MSVITGSGKTEQLLLFSNPASDYCQRWNDRQHSWRHTSEGGFNHLAFEVAEISQAEAIAFCAQHHYAGKPGGMLRGGLVGLYEHAALVGVAAFTNGSFPDTLLAAFPELEPNHESRELGRLVLLDRVPANAESWFLAEAFRLQAALGVRGVVSMSDPLPRVDSQGRLSMPGHVGTIYQASNATYTGRVTPRTIWHLPTGEIFNEQNICKIRQQKQGHAYAEAVLEGFGASPKQPSESGIQAWHRMQTEAGCWSQRHPGNHRYQFSLRPHRPGLSKRQERIARRSDPVIRLGGQALPYPKKERTLP